MKLSDLMSVQFLRNEMTLEEKQQIVNRLDGVEKTHQLFNDIFNGSNHIKAVTELLNELDLAFITDVESLFPSYTGEQAEEIYEIYAEGDLYKLARAITKNHFDPEGYSKDIWDEVTDVERFNTPEDKLFIEEFKKLYGNKSETEIKDILINHLLINQAQTESDKYTIYHFSETDHWLWAANEAIGEFIQRYNDNLDELEEYLKQQTIYALVTAEQWFDVDVVVAEIINNSDNSNNQQKIDTNIVNKFKQELNNLLGESITSDNEVKLMLIELILDGHTGYDDAVVELDEFSEEIQNKIEKIFEIINSHQFRTIWSANYDYFTTFGPDFENYTDTDNDYRDAVDEILNHYSLESILNLDNIINNSNNSDNQQKFDNYVDQFKYELNSIAPVVDDNEIKQVLINLIIEDVTQTSLGDEVEINDFSFDLKMKLFDLFQFVNSHTFRMDNSETYSEFMLDYIDNPAEGVMNFTDFDSLYTEIKSVLNQYSMEQIFQLDNDNATIETSDNVSYHEMLLPNYIYTVGEFKDWKNFEKTSELKATNKFRVIDNYRDVITVELLNGKDNDYISIEIDNNIVEPNNYPTWGFITSEYLGEELQ